jgi:ferric-dicitrate binding protein FerR (iron transport regulator)
MSSEIDYDDLIIRFIKGDTLPEENTFLLIWKKAHPANEALFNTIRETWMATSQIKHPDVFDENTALNILLKKIEITTSEQHPAGNTFTLNYFLKVAAIFIGIFISGGIASYFLFHDTTVATNQVIKIVAPKGSRSVAYLPDGSRVWLNAGSELTYKINSGQNREVKLVGEAFFKVKSDKNHPFIVSANGMFIKALGTSFNVKAYPEERKVTTTLVEGIVKIEKPGLENGKPIDILLKPNQKVVVFNDSSLFYSEKSKINQGKNEKDELAVAINESEFIPAIKAQNINTDLYTSWKDDRWIIDSEEFGNLAILLERRYNVNIEFRSNILEKYRFSGTFTNETIEQAMELMRYTLPFKYGIDKNNIVIMVDPVLLKSYNQAYEKK